MGLSVLLFVRENYWPTAVSFGEMHPRNLLGNAWQSSDDLCSGLDKDETFICHWHGRNK